VVSYNPNPVSVKVGTEAAGTLVRRGWAKWAQDAGPCSLRTVTVLYGMDVLYRGNGQSCLR